MKDQDKFELQENLLLATTPRYRLEEEEEEEEEAEAEPTLPVTYPYTIRYKEEILTITSPNWRESKILKFQIVFAFFVFIIIGLGDQAIGTLLPTLIHHYNTKQGNVTFVFILQFIGYSTSAISNSLLHLKFGRRGVILISTLFLVIPFGFNSIEPRLWMFILIHLFYGLAVGLLDSCLNVFLSSLIDNNELMGLLHGFYGVGSILSPPFISWILKTFNNRFGYFYFILFIMATFATLIGGYLFKNETKMKYEWSIKDGKTHYSDDDDDDDDDGRKEDSDLGFLNLLKDKFILANAGYIFLYLGTEISIGSWLLSYLIKVKHLEQMSASLIVSWFWIGLTAGRMCLGFVTKIFKNEYRANLFYSFTSLGCYLVYTIYTLSFDTNNFNWFKFFNILLIFICGIFIGPLFPTSNISLMNCLSTKLHVLAVGIMSSLGGTGSAVLPFFIGNLTEWTSPQLLPIYISSIIVGYCILWLFLPRLTTNIISYDF